MLYLENLNIVDFTTRLPGPLATMVLSHFGASVTKIENSDFGLDSFNSEEAKKFTPNFLDWYQRLNQEKEIKQLSFERDAKKIESHINNAEIILIPDSRFFNEFIKGFNLNNKAVIKLSGGKEEWKSLHDLNALAMTKTFLGQKKPPYLPIAGIAFGQFLATAALAVLRKVEQTNKTLFETFYLKDTAQFIFDSIYSERKAVNGLFLHEGAFPCYNFYSTRDGKTLCLAAIEEKYWMRLLSLFNLELELNDRFDTSGNTQEILKNLFANHTASEIRQVISKTNICLSIIEG